MTESNGEGDQTGSGREVIETRRGMFGVSGSGDTSGYGRLVREITLPGSSPRPVSYTHLTLPTILLV